MPVCQAVINSKGSVIKLDLKSIIHVKFALQKTHPINWTNIYTEIHSNLLRSLSETNQNDISSVLYDAYASK